MDEKNKYWILNFFGLCLLRRSDGKLVKYKETSGFVVDYTDSEIKK